MNPVSADLPQSCLPQKGYDRNDNNFNAIEIRQNVYPVWIVHIVSNFPYMKPTIYYIMYAT